MCQGEVGSLLFGQWDFENYDVLDQFMCLSISISGSRPGRVSFYIILQTFFFFFLLDHKWNNSKQYRILYWYLLVFKGKQTGTLYVCVCVCNSYNNKQLKLHTRQVFKMHYNHKKKKKYIF